MTQECKMKGLLWRVLGVLPVAAVLLVANAKVTAQEKTEVPPTKEEKIKGFWTIMSSNYLLVLMTVAVLPSNTATTF